MRSRGKSGRYVKFVLYALVIVLANIAGITLFKRFDLTANKVYSLSEASKRVVAGLSEPLTINVFFTEDLPAPHNNTARYLMDLLEEYAAFSNQYFNFRFFNVSAEEGDLSADAKENQKLANNYGIHPLQIQVIDKDEVKFQRAYMGLVMIHGDLIERIPAITTTDGLEYRLTTGIQKMTNKISALMALSGDIKATLYMSSSLEAVAPFMGIRTMDRLPEEIEATVADVSTKNYNRLKFEYINPPDDRAADQIASEHNLLMLSWPTLSDGNIPAGKGVIGLVLEYEDRVASIPLLQVLRLPLIGTQYKLTEKDGVEENLNAAIDSLININADIGYLADFGSLQISSVPPGMPGMPQDQSALNNFQQLVSQNYTIRDVRLGEEDLPEGLRSLIIAGPRQPLSDYALFQIDQFLMQGNHLILFLDRFDEQMPGGQASQFQPRPPQYQPIDTGLEKLLDHYGVRIKSSYVMDENCFRQQVPQRLGGGERPIYFAPMIKDENIHQDLGFLNNIKALITLKVSPLELDTERLKAQAIQAHELVASSDRAWEMRGRINLNPLFIRPPSESDQFSRLPLAYLLEGEFSSYFAGKPIPVREVKEDRPEKEAGEPDQETQPAAELSKIERRGQFLEKGRPGKIFIMASSEMLKDNVLDADGRGTNAMFVLNTIDYLNGNEDIAIMRSKEQRFNPLRETSAGTKTFAKTFNVVGLPVLASVFGLLVWLRRSSRKKRIQMMFDK
jgi:ABC-type uncharacterized transport system involved in gliding motility auxiliary subunit